MTAAQRAIASIAAAQEHEPDLSMDAMRLLTFNGLMNACAKLQDMSICGGDRDEIAALNMQHKTLKLISDVWGKVLSLNEDVESNKKLAVIVSELGRKGANASTSFEDDSFLPKTETGTDK